MNALYELPFHGNRWVEGWQISGITQLQSGNPITILTNINSFTGNATLRPDVIGPITVLDDPNKWFPTTVCDPRLGPCAADAVFALPVAPGNIFHFGNLGRNVVIGPGFANTDFSVLKNTKITETVRVQFRGEIFDIFNHANFGQPGRVAGASNFGVITSTRFPTGDSGSSRQIQFALKVIF
jgi:hypothetical protein